MTNLSYCLLSYLQRSFGDSILCRLRRHCHRDRYLLVNVKQYVRRSCMQNEYGKQHLINATPSSFQYLLNLIRVNFKWLTIAPKSIHQFTFLICGLHKTLTKHRTYLLTTQEQRDPYTNAGEHLGRFRLQKYTIAHMAEWIDGQCGCR